MHPSSYYTQPDPQFITHADPSTWQQQQYYNGHSPQDSSRATLSPPNPFNTQNYSSDYLTPSPRSSHPDSWSASSHQWVSPRESPIMDNANWNGNPAEITWNSGVANVAPLLPGPKRNLDPRQASLAPTTSSSDQRSTSGASDNDTWANSTARGTKRARMDDGQKAKAGACKHCKRLKVCESL
ncbi:hypothetical protein BN14_06286 [Rhizoctonia solani AG-1 IB]|uniref:Uncharacterized protein n=1 Tax=Thanatephorus cucumeris (strain AG1-IB / isolate 7/3/14) TaxID=1108050 RepID=M5C8T9_THACB|nr:hypothetical protein BN14_06286 [Rhizoctonia solani AG-1 IB]